MKRTHAVWWNFHILGLMAFVFAQTTLEVKSKPSTEWIRDSVNHVELETRRFINISTRGLVETGDHVMIGSFIIQADGPKTVLIRGLGPSLASTMDAPVLLNPELTLVSSDNPDTSIAFNDDWRDTDEAALVATLEPGAYTAVVRGAGFSTGYCQLELYYYPEW